MTDRELMQMAFDALESIERLTDGSWQNPFPDERKALRDRLAQPEPEPIFYVIQATGRFGEGYEQTYWEDPLGFPVYTRPVHDIDISQERVDKTAKHKHEWVGLTDEDREEIARWADEHGHGPWHLFYAIEIENRLKEKNCG